jgi:cytochrome c-type biogenesis protein CcmH/NrfG
VDLVKPLLTVLLCLSLVAAASLPARAAEKASVQAAATTAEKPAGKAEPAPVDSVALLEKAVAKDSTQFEKLYQLGILLLDRDRATDASKVFTKAHVLRPKDHKVAVNLGAAFDALGQPVTAQAYYREALEEAPGDSVASCRLASSLYAQSRYADAIDLLRQVIKDSPTAHCAYFTLGVAFADAGIYKEAIRMWQKVVELAPSSPEAGSARESIDVLEKVIQQ